MRHIFIAGLLAFSLTPLNAAHMAQPTHNTLVDSLLGQSLGKLQGDVSVAKLNAVSSEMARLADMYPQNWLPPYYQALLGIQATLMTRNGDKAETAAMDNCYRLIEKAATLKAADPSEVHALKAYYYYVLIAMNAKVNGPSLYSRVFGECEKSLVANPQNPRAKAIAFVFKKQMGAFLHAKDNEDDTKQMQAIAALFDKENKSTVLPTWGKEILSYINLK